MSKGTKKAKGVNLTKIRDDNVIPVARKLLLAIAAREDLVMGSSETVTEEAAAEYYQELYQNVVIPMILEADLKITDIDFLFQIMEQPLHFVKEVTGSSLSLNRDLCDADLYGVKDIRDLTLSGLDKALKANADKSIR